MKNLEKLNVQEMFQGKRKDDASHPKQIKTCFFLQKNVVMVYKQLLKTGVFIILRMFVNTEPLNHIT